MLAAIGLPALALAAGETEAAPVGAASVTTSARLLVGLLALAAASATVLAALLYAREQGATDRGFRGST